ncbi:MAG: aminotransferase class III-fold pyridoxal phosphate-dependent enzyme [Verrucomicrobiota bacterium]
MKSDSLTMPNDQKNSRRSLEQSQAWLKRAEKLIPGCSQTFSKGPTQFMQGVAPNFIAKAKGAHVWDVDGNRYLDYILGLGPIILGHGYPAVQEAVIAQMENGLSYSLPHTLEVEVAELLAELIPCAEMVRFAKNGSDVTTAAVRVSRGFTRRDKVACCGYHGWQDWFIGSTSRNLGVPEAVRKLTVTFSYNDLAALHRVFHDHPNEIACVILEPVTFNLPSAGYLEGVKELCRKNGALLVFDEVVTGFRIDLRGAQGYFGVTPDLACFGKGIANGFPLAAITGRAEVMRLFTEVFFSTTHGGEALSLAAGLTTINEMRSKDVIGHLKKVGQKLKDETNRLAAQHGIARNVECAGLPAWTTLRFCDAEGKASPALRSLFQQEALKRGLLTHGNHMLSFSHDDAIIEFTLRAYGEIFAILAEALGNNSVEQRLESAALQPVIRQST